MIPLNRFIDLWTRVGGRGDARCKYQDLKNRYSEPHRRYHDFNHITYCLGAFDKVNYLAIHPDCLELALWYHDAVYDFDRTDNEVASAALALQDLDGSNLTLCQLKLIQNIIEATDHKPLDDTVDFDIRLGVDIDLSILAAPINEFNVYDSKIREEYNWVPEFEFVTNRSRLLLAMLTRPRIFLTGHFIHNYEDQARVNIYRAIDRLLQTMYRLLQTMHRRLLTESRPSIKPSIKPSVKGETQSERALRKFLDACGKEPPEDDGASFGNGRPGTWSLRSKSHPEWNCGGFARGSTIGQVSDADEAVRLLAAVHGLIPNDLRYAFWKD